MPAPQTDPIAEAETHILLIEPASTAHTGTTISVVGNSNLVKNRQANQQDTVTIATNGGDFQANEKAHLKSLTKLEPVWYNSKVGGNVLSFAEIEDHPMYELD